MYVIVFEDVPFRFLKIEDFSLTTVYVREPVCRFSKIDYRLRLRVYCTFLRSSFNHFAPPIISAINLPRLYHGQ
jgi:hypothetical protein